MHHFILATKDTWITSGSSHIDETSFRDQNFGQDQILEVRKEFFNNTFDYPTRALISFKGTEFTKMSQSIENGEITNPKFYLRLYEAEGNTEGTSNLSTEYKLLAQPLSQSWEEGRGKFGDDPKVTNGVSWENRTYPDNGSATTWSLAGASGSSHGGAIHLDLPKTSAVSASVQSFSHESPDVELDISDMVKSWLSSSTIGDAAAPAGGFPNEGLLLRWSGSQETDTEKFGHLKFFSRNTHTIYAPKLEVRWDDHIPCTGSNTGSLNQLTMSGESDNYLYMIGLREFYRESEKIKFRVGARKRYIQKTFSTSVQTHTGSFIPEGSGSYAIKDSATDEFIVPFSGYTSMSCDSKSNYFIQWLDGFYPDRTYKILYKIKYNDGQEQIYDNNFEFVIKR